MGLFAVSHVRERPIAPDLLESTSRLLFWEFPEIWMPDHYLAGAVLPAVYAPHLHIELIPKGLHHRQFVDLAVYVPLS